VLELLGRLDIEGAEPNEAAEIVQKFLETDPTDLEARRALAYHYMVLGKTREASSLVKECLEIRPDFVSAWEILVASLYDLGDFAALEAALDELPETGRETAWYWRFQATNLERRDQPEQAARALEHALAIDPFDSRLHYLLGRVYHQLGNDEGNAEHITRWQELAAARARRRELYREVILSNQRGTGPSSELCFNMGSHYELMGVYDGAVAWHRESLRRDPTNAMSREALERLEPKNLERSQ